MEDALSVPSMSTSASPSVEAEGLIISEYETFARLPEWVLDAEISDRAVRLFAVLLRHADKGGKAFPSRARIAERLRCSVDRVDLAIKELVGIGALRVVKNGGKPGEPYRANTYYLLRRPSRADAATPSRAAAATPSRVDAATLAAQTRHEREPVNESQKNEKNPPPPSGSAPRKRGAARDEEPEGFAEWYAAYPLRRSRAAAARAYRGALRKTGALKTTPEALLAAAEAYRDDPTRKPEFTKLPSTWLNGGCWADEGPASAHETAVDPVEAGRRWAEEQEAAQAAAQRGLPSGGIIEGEVV